MAIDTAVRANGAHLKHLQQRLQRAHNGKQDAVHRVGEWGMGQQRICARRRCPHFAATVSSCNVGVSGALAAAPRLAHDNKVGLPPHPSAPLYLTLCLLGLLVA